MFYIVPTKKGLGIEIWGTSDDLEQIHKLIGNWWGLEEKQKEGNYGNRDELISSFSYELRHAYQGDRLKRDHPHFSFANIPYCGFQISWVHALFSLAVLKSNAQEIGLNKFERGFFLQFDFWLESAMQEFDPIGKKSLLPFIDGAIYISNPCLYQFMRSINIEYFLLRGGKVNFRKLSGLMSKACYNSEEYKEYWANLQVDATHLNCLPSELDFNEDDSIYEIEW